MTKFFGIDYSMSTPAIVALPSETADWTEAKALFLTEKNKYQQHFNKSQIIGKAHKLWKCPEQRWDQIAQGIMECLSPSDDSFIALEDYSMGSKGKVFHIAENTGMLKHYLWRQNYEYILVPPTVLKKNATGKGNAKKEQMYEFFLSQTAVDLSKIMGQTGKLDSPVTDIVDAYYLARYAQEVYREQNTPCSIGPKT